ncbi:hypothetical protein SUGI_0433900 [Cryptomeria japonica]|nr:hypothetical protein SUGI_0433900 [Cryptomeria japonica]
MHLSSTVFAFISSFHNATIGYPSPLGGDMLYVDRICIKRSLSFCDGYACCSLGVFERCNRNDSLVTVWESFFVSNGELAFAPSTQLPADCGHITFLEHWKEQTLDPPYNLYYIAKKS